MSSLDTGGDAVARRTRSSKMGRGRMMEIARENQVVIDALVVDLLGSLQRQPLPTERILAEAIGAATVRCRRLREQGRCEAVERRELARLIRSFNQLPKAQRETA